MWNLLARSVLKPVVRLWLLMLAPREVMHARCSQLFVYTKAGGVRSTFIGAFTMTYHLNGHPCNYMWIIGAPEVMGPAKALQEVISHLCRKNWLDLNQRVVTPLAVRGLPRPLASKLLSHASSSRLLVLLKGRV